MVAMMGAFLGALPGMFFVLMIASVTSVAVALGVYELVQRRERARGRGFVLTGRRSFALTAEAVHLSTVATAAA